MIKREPNFHLKAKEEVTPFFSISVFLASKQIANDDRDVNKTSLFQDCLYDSDRLHWHHPLPLHQSQDLRRREGHSGGFVIKKTVGAK